MPSKNAHPLAVVILAAGRGTRMRSSLPKVLHTIGSQPMLCHVLDTVTPLNPKHKVLVLAPGMEPVKKAVAAHGMTFAEQNVPRGTGDAVKTALPSLKGFKGTVLVLYGDTPLITTASLQALLAEKQARKAAIALLGIELDDPTGYGRLVMAKPPLVERIVECKDASAKQKQIRWGWGGVMAFDAAFLHETLAKLKPSPVTKEYYLTTLLEMAAAKGLRSVMVPAAVEEAMGVNDRAQLAAAEAVFQTRARARHMAAGVTLRDPASVYFSADTVIAPDVVIDPHVVIGPGVTIASGSHIRAFSHLEGAKVGAHGIVGPFARLRPGAHLAPQAHVGNFVEIKQSIIGEGAKINHLSYIGDACVGAGTNIGAGTIVCNYDGYKKYRTTIGGNVFVGSHSTLVSPVTVADGAFIAAGSVITEDVTKDALAVGRARQVEKKGWAKKFRAKKK